MKLLSLLTVFTLTTGTAFAAYEGPRYANHQEGTAQAAASANDDTKMILEGKIINQISKEKYTFQDSTGTIIAEIDNDEMRGITFDETTPVRLIGEVDKDFGKDAEFDVKVIEIIK